MDERWIRRKTCLSRLGGLSRVPPGPACNPSVATWFTSCRCWHDQSPWCLPSSPEAIPHRFQLVQSNPCSDDPHDEGRGPDIPGHRGITQGQLQGVQSGILQTPKAANGLSGLLPEGLGHNVVHRAAAGVAELVGDLLVGASQGTDYGIRPSSSSRRLGTCRLTRCHLPMTMTLRHKRDRSPGVRNCCPRRWPPGATTRRRRRRPFWRRGRSEPSIPTAMSACQRVPSRRLRQTWTERITHRSCS